MNKNDTYNAVDIELESTSSYETLPYGEPQLESPKETFKDGTSSLMPTISDLWQWMLGVIVLWVIYAGVHSVYGYFTGSSSESEAVATLAQPETDANIQNGKAFKVDSPDQKPTESRLDSLKEELERPVPPPQPQAQVKKEKPSMMSATRDSLSQLEKYLFKGLRVKAKKPRNSASSYTTKRSATRGIIEPSRDDVDYVREDGLDRF